MWRKKSAIWYLGTCIVLLLFDLGGLTKFIKNPLDKGVTSIQKTVYQIKVFSLNTKNIILSYPAMAKIINEWENLKKENIELKFSNQNLSRENNKLRLELESPLPPSFKFITAAVAGVSRFMILAVGEKDGVKTDLSVVSGTTLIGKIHTVSENRSTVMLPSDPDIIIPVKTNRGTRGEISGQAGFIYMMKVLQKDQLFLDDLVATSGEGGFPPNLIIGKVKHIQSDDVAPYKSAKIESILDFQKEDVVFVVNSL